MKLTIENMNLDKRGNAALAIMFAQNVEWVCQDNITVSDTIALAFTKLMTGNLDNSEEDNDLMQKCYKVGDEAKSSRNSYVIYAAANALEGDANHAANAAAWAALSERMMPTVKDVKEYIHDRLLEVLPFILRYKARNGSSFISPKVIEGFISEEDQEFLFQTNPSPKTKTYKVAVTEGVMRWYDEEGRFHREDGPAITYENDGKRWYINGKLHREDGPAVVMADGSVRWYLNGVRLSEEDFAVKMLNPSEGFSVKYKDGEMGFSIKDGQLHVDIHLRLFDMVTDAALAPSEIAQLRAMVELVTKEAGK